VSFDARITSPLALVRFCFVEVALFRLLLPPSFMKVVPVPTANEIELIGEVFSRILPPLSLELAKTCRTEFDWSMKRIGRVTPSETRQTGYVAHPAAGVKTDRRTRGSFGFGFAGSLSDVLVTAKTRPLPSDCSD
jgi:hypothetical protein